MTMSLETTSKKMEEVESRKIGSVEVENMQADNVAITDQIIISKLTNDITELLKYLGIPANVKGFEYLRYAILLKCLYPNRYVSLTKELYPEVAKHYETTWSRMERACRYAVEQGFCSKNMKQYDEIFGYTVNPDKSNLVNSVFIATLSEYINCSNREELSNQHGTVVEETAVYTRITKLLKNLGIPTNIRGFEYLRYAIYLKYMYPDKYWEITKELYPEVAKHYSTTWIRVERTCRRAIEMGYDRGSLELYDEIFGYTINSKKGKPINSEFISALADYLSYKDREDSSNCQSENEKVNDELMVCTKELINKTTDILKTMGIPTNVKGFEYIRYGIMLKCLYPNRYAWLTKELYPEIAKHYETTYTRVECACRHAIESGYERGNQKLYYEIFGNTLGKQPTNSIFFATICDYLSKETSNH